MWKACSMVKSGEISAEDFAEAVWRHYASRPRIGELALKERLLTMKQVFIILSDQGESGEPFGRIAIAHGFLNHEQLSDLLMLQSEVTTPVDKILVEMGAVDPSSLASPVDEVTLNEASGVV